MGLKYQDKRNSLPLIIKTGVSYRFNHLTAAADVIKTNDGSLRENIGMEYTIGKLFSLRAGYKIGYDLDSWAFGLGFKLKWVDIDYGMAIMDVLDSTHRTSLTYYF